MQSDEQRIRDGVGVKPTFFASPSAFRAWLSKHHASAAELVVGFYKVDSGKPSITWPESVDEALCVGWIDGIRRRIDDASYSIRFTPRRPRSIWSAVNVKRVEALIALGRMQPAGLAAFQSAHVDKTAIYTYEQPNVELAEPYLGALKRNKPAWDFYVVQQPSYRKSVNWWILSAKQEATQLRRLEKLIAHSAAGKWIPEFLRPAPAARPARAVRSPPADRGPVAGQS